MERADLDAHGVLQSVDLELQLPSTFPVKYREAIIQVVDQCSVKRAIAAQPLFSVRTSPPA